MATNSTKRMGDSLYPWAESLFASDRKPVDMAQAFSASGGTSDGNVGEEIEVLRRKAAALDAIMDAEYDPDYGVTVARAINTDAPINAADFLDLFVRTVVETNPVEDLYK